MNSFTELTKQVHLIDDLILSDMRFENKDSLAEETQIFNRHLLSTKNWFTRISWSNKKRYLLGLLDDVRSAWTLSLLLKSLWNCRPKDAVLSVSEVNVWSSYDQVPIDHNRTAQPVHTLALVMKNDRAWFLSLDPEPQVIVLSELLAVSGGLIKWEVLRRAQTIYEKYRDEQLHNLKECIVVNEPVAEKVEKHLMAADKNKVEPTSSHRRKGSGSSQVGTKHPFESGQAQKELETNLEIWNTTIKALRDSVKLEELEMTFKDGTKRKIWKVNRPKPEAIETVDYIQLLPAAIGKRILSYLPRTQLGDYAKVNKYWAYLVDDFKAELAARQKINSDLEKLQELMFRHDISMEVLTPIGLQVAPQSSQGATSAAHSNKMWQLQASMRPSERSAGAMSFRRLHNDKLMKSVMHQKPIRNLAQLTERLEQRGAADDNLWTWCENIIKHVNTTKNKGSEEGVLQLGNLHFPCPLMKSDLDIPLKKPLCKDPTEAKTSKHGKNISNATTLNISKPQTMKRYSLWTKDFSKLYPVFKIPSHQSPI